MNTASLQVRDLHLYYGKFLALKGVTLDLAPGSFLALLGPSGCGKTSLLRSIAGFNVPQSGSIEIGGRDILSLPPRARGLGFVFQNYALFPHMTALENVAFGLRCRGVGREQIRERATRALELVDLAALAGRKPGQLSGGQQQRVALARALVIEPSVLLLDEPLGALDKKLRVEMQTELKALQKRLGVTSVFVTHDQEEAMAMADTIAIMNEGEIEQLGTPREIFSTPRTRWAAEFVGSGNVLQGEIDAKAGAAVLTVANGCRLELAGAAPRAGRVTAFVRADQTLLEPTGNATDFTVVSQRYLGLHVEVQAAYGQGIVKALVPVDAAEDLAVGTRVAVRATPAACRIISD